MSNTRLIQKALIGVEDLLLGESTVTQTRNGATAVTITKINADEIPYSGDATNDPSDVVTIKEKIDMINTADIDQTLNSDDDVQFQNLHAVDTVTVGVTTDDAETSGMTSGLEVRGSGGSGTVRVTTDETGVESADVLGSVEFQAPVELSGTVAKTVSASIQAVSTGTFSSIINPTDVVINTAATGAVSEVARFTSGGNFVVDSGNVDVTSGSLVARDGNIITFDGYVEARGPAGTGSASAGVAKLTTAELSVESGDELGRVDFQAPLESDDVDSVVVGASIVGVASAEFTDAVNSTDLVFKTASSGVATEKVRITSDGDVDVASGGDVNLTSGDVAVTTGSVTVGTGDVEVTAGNITTSAGTITNTLGDIVATEGDITATSGDVNIDDGNLVLGTAGKGVDFSGVGTAAEILDDYEEGVFTPDAVFSGTDNPTIANAAGFYTKVGNLVNFQLKLVFSVNTSTGSLSVTGLPETSNSATDADTTASIFVNRIGATGKIVTCFIQPGTDVILMRLSDAGTAAAATVDIANVGASAWLVISGSYRV